MPDDLAVIRARARVAKIGQESDANRASCYRNHADMRAMIADLTARVAELERRLTAAVNINT